MSFCNFLSIMDPFEGLKSILCVIRKNRKNRKFGLGSWVTEQGVGNLHSVFRVDRSNSFSCNFSWLYRAILV